MTLHLSLPCADRPLIPRDRVPIDTIDKAIGRLVELHQDPRNTPDALALASAMVADFFWISDANVAHKVRKAANEIGGVVCLAAS